MAIKRYHVNPETGNSGICLAQRRCRFGADSFHYPSAYDARARYERDMLKQQMINNQVSPGTVTKLPDGIITGDNKSAVVPAGDYFLCDPYIALATRDQEGWNNVVETIDKTYGWENDIADPDEQKVPIIGVMFNNAPLVMAKSFQGNGLHWSVGPVNRIPSDSGLIGLVPESAMRHVDLKSDLAENLKMGARISLDQPTHFWRDENGVLLIGGKTLIVHTELVPGKNFEALDEMDGKEKRSATGKTYEKLKEQAALWREDPEALAAQGDFGAWRNVKSGREDAGVEEEIFAN